VKSHTCIPITFRRKNHIVTLNLSMQDRLAKRHAGRTYQSLHLLLMQCTFNEFVIQPFVRGGQEMTLHNQDRGQANGHSLTTVEETFGPVMRSKHDVQV
jgi:hypothetical protein